MGSLAALERQNTAASIFVCLIILYLFTLFRVRLCLIPDDRLGWGDPIPLTLLPLYTAPVLPLTGVDAMRRCEAYSDREHRSFIY